MDALCIPDLHCPFEHPDALKFIMHVDRVWFPGGSRFVVCMGDEVDQHTLGRWPSNPSGRSGGDELKEARHRLSHWFDQFPKVFVCSSNHTYRAWKKAFHSGIPAEFMRGVNEVYGAPPGWLWRDRWVHGGICFEHGEMVSGAGAALNAAKQNQMPTVIGHIHTYGGVQHCDNETGKIWGLNTGCLIDISMYSFEYGKSIRIKPSLGCGVIRNSIPYFVPMILDLHGRWVGYI